MPAQIDTEATVVADLILLHLKPLVDEYEEAMAWHTKSEAATYMTGYRDCTLAVREAVVRALEAGVFAEMIEAGVIPRYKADRRKAA